MKATIIGTDLLKHGDSVKILDINSNPEIYNKGAEFFDYDSLFNMLSKNYIKEFHFIKTDQDYSNLNDNINSTFESKLIENCNKYDIEYISYSVAHNSISVPTISDSRDKFILRQAYDEYALVDSTYCFDKYQFISLMDGSSYIPNSFFYSDELHHNSLNSLDINDSIFPNIIQKSRFNKKDSSTLPILSKYFDELELIDKKSNLHKDLIIQEFVIDTENIVDGYWNVIKSFDIIYGLNLDTINMGGYLDKSYRPLSFCENEYDETGVDLNTESKFKFLNRTPNGVSKNSDVSPIESTLRDKCESAFNDIIYRIKERHLS